MSSGGVSDSSDWLSTPLASLAPIEAALRCHVCKDFMKTPMITSCSHTFCSICIRRCLSSDARCPICRTAEQSLKLKPNWIVEELVQGFVAAREGLLKVATSKRALDEDEEEVKARPSKRARKTDTKASQEDRRQTRSSGRTTRSQTQPNDRAAALATAMREDDVVEVQDSEYEASDAEDSYDAPPREESRPQPNDGLVVCPMCLRRMKEEAVFSHLDNCKGPEDASRTVRGGVSSPSRRSTNTLPTSTRPPLAQPLFTQASAPITQNERLPAMNYALYTETALRKKLRELGIANHGSKLRLQKRHTEWVNIWNANADSRYPRSKSDLMRDLAVWDRSLDAGGGFGQAFGGSGLGLGTISSGDINTPPATVGEVLKKDFNRGEWSERYDSMFRELIAEGREQAAIVASRRAKEKEAEDAKKSQQQENNTTLIQPNHSALFDITTSIPPTTSTMAPTYTAPSQPSIPAGTLPPTSSSQVEEIRTYTI